MAVKALVLNKSSLEYGLGVSSKNHYPIQPMLRVDQDY